MVPILTSMCFSSLFVFLHVTGPQIPDFKETHTPPSLTLPLKSYPPVKLTYPPKIDPLEKEAPIGNHHFFRSWLY